jgi:hypothetical protein
MALSITIEKTTLGINDIEHYASGHNAGCHYAEGHHNFFVVLSVMMLIV